VTCSRHQTYDTTETDVLGKDSITVLPSRGIDRPLGVCQTGTSG
jgi:hypothetical protein